MYLTLLGLELDVEFKRGDGLSLSGREHER
jgi:hypothetical protein